MMIDAIKEMIRELQQATGELEPVVKIVLSHNAGNRLMREASMMWLPAKPLPSMKDLTLFGVKIELAP